VRCRGAVPSANVAPLPKRQSVNGVSFVEFASRGAEAEALDIILKTLGFVHTGNHISKQLSLWTQGDIRIVVNRETIGFASSAYVAHGSTVCAVGLSVDDASDAALRARKLGAEHFEQPTGPGELNIPAIRGLSGSVLHLVDEVSGLSEVWDLEFTAVHASDHMAGLTRIDHLAQTMSYDEMLSWSLFYSTLFKMNKSPMVDVIDPDGLVRSQALETVDGAFRITLNGAETHRTMAGRFLADSFGASVQHIALACDDIFATAKALAMSGFEPLEIPENYYADLAARFDLSSEMLSQLSVNNILYDEDENGSFFQMYSKPFLKNMFFEIVERRGNYQGYGAPNAPFRIAAQKRLLRPKGVPKA
jgi:4-hydroxyphenylpyruvate dioxygenase